MATYAFRDAHGDVVLLAPEFEKPAPTHTMTEGAEEAIESIRRLGHERRAERIIAALVTEHGHKRVIPYDGPIPAAAKTTLWKALAAGFDAELVETTVGCVVQGIHKKRRVGFRAWWEYGKTTGGTWHSGGRDRWKLIDISSRPIGVDARTKLTKAKHRHDANDRTRLVLIESPRGVSCKITEIERRIAS